MFPAFIFSFAIAATFCYLECFVTDLVNKNNHHGETGRICFIVAMFLWGLYHYLIH